MAKKEKLDYTALIRQLRAEGPGKLYLLWGEETYLREQFTSELRRACLGTHPTILTTSALTARTSTSAFSAKRWIPCPFSPSGYISNYAALI